MDKHMGIKCSHCGAMNPADSMFCGECGWQIMDPDAELEIEQSIASAQKKADLAPVKPVPAKPEPARPEPLPDDLPAAGEPGPELEPVVSPVEAEVEPVALKPVPVEEPASPEVEPEPEPVAVRVEAGDEPATVVTGQDAISEAMSGVVPALDRETYGVEEGVSITSSAAIIGDRIYAWEDIISVSMEVSPANRLPSLLLAVVGAIILALAITGLGGNPVLGIVLIAGGLLLLAIGAVLVITASNQYMVCVETASGVEAALVSSDREHVQRVVRSMRRPRDE